MAKRLTPEEKAQRAADREAKAKSDRDAYIKKLVDDWPPLTDDQIWKLRKIMRLHEPADAPRGPSPYELEQQQKLREKEKALADAKKLALSLTACDVCDIQPEQHYYAQKGAIDMHEWQPGRAAKVLAKQQAKS